MTNGHESLRNVLVAGFTAPTTAAERKAAFRRPYPVPAAMAPARDQVLRELEARLPDEGDGPPTVTRALGPIESYRETVRLLGLPGCGLFEFADATCALIAVGALTTAEVEDLAPFLREWCGFRRQFVLNRIIAGDLEGARLLAGQLENEFRWRAYRDIGTVLAARGDARGFFTEWRHYGIARDRDDLAELAKLLVAGVARREGWRPAPTVTRAERISPFGDQAFSAFIHTADVEGLQRVLDSHAVGILSELDQLVLLSIAIKAATEPNPQCNHPLLDTVIDRLIAIDPTEDKRTMHRRDAELVGLWPAIGDQSTLACVRKAVRGYREELTRLPRDTPTCPN